MKVYTLAWKYERGISGVFCSRIEAERMAENIRSKFPDTQTYMQPDIEEWEI